MTEYSLTDAKARIGHLITRALAGEEIVLTSYGSPTVALVPVASLAVMQAAWLREVERSRTAAGEPRPDLSGNAERYRELVENQRPIHPYLLNDQ